jgi:putative ABC transport system ATP-binding protein
MKAESSPPPLIRVHNLVVSFSRWGQMVTAVNKVSFEVTAGEWLLLAGHNGAGKSTLLKAIAGELTPTRGNITINERRPSDLSPRDLASTVFAIRQDPLLGSAPLLTIFENLLVADPRIARIGEPRTELLRRYGALLEPLGLADRMRQPVKLLSGGERQLLAMAIATLRPAPAILLDEPLAALDTRKAELCLEQIARMHGQGKTIIQVAHDLRVLRDLADRMITLKDGTLANDEVLKTGTTIPVTGPQLSPTLTHSSST